ncbi:glycosyltransferase family 39 protein, partial [bacterium]|nr:glycosyltransferase family 39 protein [bacterium]
MPDITAPRWTQIAAAALIAVHLALALGSARLKSPTADEYTYISTAYLYDKTGDFRLDRTHPPLVRLLIGAPLQWLDLNMPPRQQELWDEPVSQRLGYDIGWKMLLDGSNDPQRILFWSRLPVMLLSCGLAGLLFVWGRRLYGDGGGLLTLALYCFSPNILAHARLATLDLGACFFMTLALYAFDRQRAAASWKWTLAAGAALGLALSAKATGLLLAPVILAALMLKQGASGLKDQQHWRRALRDGAVIFATTAVVLLLTYGFPFKPIYYWDTLQNVFYKSLHSGEGAVDVPGMPHLNYAFYLLGDYSTQGWPYYSLVAFLAKTPVAILLALMIAFISTQRWRGWTDGLILGTIALLFIASAFNRVNIGLRHILPIYPLLFLYLGRLALLPKRRWQKAGLSCLMIWFIISSCVAFPDYLPY